MKSLYDMERNRLKVYGEMLKNELTQHKKQEQLEKEEKIKREQLELEQHIQNTKLYNNHRKAEQRELNKSLFEDNLMLSTFKQALNQPHSYAQEGTSFLEGLQSLDSQRLDRLKKQLAKQANDNYLQQSNRKAIQERIRQIESIEEARHQERIKQMQTESLRNYQQIKKKHQQDMSLYERHKQLMGENQYYRDQLEEFTKVNNGLLDRFNRNDYIQRRAHQIQNQSHIKKQIEQLQRRKSQEVIDYRQSVGDLEHSMLKSMLVKPQRYQPRAYSHDLKDQMRQHTIKKIEQNNQKKEKVEINNIFGGVHGREREKMLSFIDKRLGIDTYLNKSQLNSSINSFQAKAEPTNFKQTTATADNPEQAHRQQSKSSTPRVPSRRSSANREYYRLPPNPLSDPAIAGEHNSTGPKSFRSYDVVSGRNKIYQYD